MDRLFRNVKTGEERRLPPMVYEANKKNWREVVAFVEVNGEETSQPQESAKTEAPPTREQLIAIYTRLAGGNPDGRWSNQKLAQKIEELKEAK
jgi:hypothetical protein